MEKTRCNFVFQATSYWKLSIVNIVSNGLEEKALLKENNNSPAWVNIEGNYGNGYFINWRNFRIPLDHFV